LHQCRALSIQDEPVSVCQPSQQQRCPVFRSGRDGQRRLVFPKDRLATFVCSFGASDASTYQIVGTRDLVVKQPEYSSAITYTLTTQGKAEAAYVSPRGTSLPLS
jgi:glucose-fructose oxidoreductase